MGYADFAHTILQNYFNDYFPSSYEVSQQLRERGGPEQVHALPIFFPLVINYYFNDILLFKALV